MKYLTNMVSMNISGWGGNITYQNATSTQSGLQGNYYNTNTFTYTTYLYSNTYKISFLTFSTRGSYHFSAGTKFDPYAGVDLGYCLLSSPYSTTDIYNGGAGSSTTSAGVEIGAFVGARYFFSDHVGIRVELQYSDAASNGISVNASNLEMWVLRLNYKLPLIKICLIAVFLFICIFNL